MKKNAKDLLYFILFFLSSISSCWAVNPINVVLSPRTGLPSITHVGEKYSISYTFTNNLEFSVPIYVTGSSTDNAFESDGLCTSITLAPKGQPGSSCTTYIDFNPSTPGATRYNALLKYHHNVIPLRPNLTSVVTQLCGTIVYPSNTGVPAQDPIINSNQVWHFASAPELHPMKVDVNAYVSDLLAPGLLFNAPYTGSGVAAYGQNGALIVDNDANPIWFRALSSASLMNTDVKIQMMNNHPVLTFWQGTLATPPSYTNIPAGGAEPGGCYYILDTHYRIINTVTAFYDFVPDEHEFLITPNQTVLFFATKVVPMDLTPYGGPKDGSIHDYSIQEVDLATNKLIFFWDALDHIPLSSSLMPIISATQSSNVWDPYHLNSIGLIPDNPDDLLISGRNTWTIYRLNKTTGAFVWQLKGNGEGDFSIPNPAATFAWQHDARYVSDHTISLFDDECCADITVVPPGTTPSHGLLLDLDFVHMTVSLNTSYYHDPNVYSSSQGNNQLLSNGNRLIGFGSRGSYTENAASGNTEQTPALNILYSAQMPGSNMSYRSYRQDWISSPYYPPSIAVNKNHSQATVYASWNGATEVSNWQVYVGHYSDSLTLVANAVKNGFETTINVSNVSSGGAFFQVKALNSRGQIIGVSKIIYKP